MPPCSWPATNRVSSTAMTSWSTAPSPVAATGLSSSRGMWRSARHSIRGREKKSRRNDGQEKERGNKKMFATTTFTQPDARPVHLSIIAGLACAFLIAKMTPLTRDLVTSVIEPFCMASAADVNAQNVVEPITSHALPNVAGKRVTVVRVFYGPGGFTPPHYHSGSVTAYITKGEIRSQLDGGPVETFKVGQSFFEPPGSKHLVSANASNTEPAELIAIFVADEGAQLTTLLKQ